MPKGVRYPVINGMKFCPKCQTTKPVSEFYPDPRSRWGVRSPCKQCMAESNRERYEQEGSVGKINNAARIARRYELKRKLVEAAGGKCSRCGYDKSIYALDFHHTQPDKEAQVSALIFRAAAGSEAQLRAALAEAKKCVLLCANCHREEHATL